ncbi:sortase [uncultured Methanobrevibacter sp.]|uniref:sortase n=1 Tax=uncultured Methanobrevibacter sp. TaxID=253161 RepID=UPI002601117B|nr:class E sortase [uncultured Methanobrevibacter sp.]
MNKPSIMTIIVIICILIIGLYAMGEVNYFSSKISIERNIESPVIVIPSIGVQEKINNETLDQGVLHELNSYTPDSGDVLLFGHRTLQGSPFLRLNELHNGDSFILEWPGIGELKYKVINTTIVPATYQLSAQEGGNSAYLITCDPIGSTENRLIIHGELSETNPINDAILKNNPQESNALIITAIFLIIGLVFSFFYPKDNRIYILATILIVSAILFYCCINPIPSGMIYDKIIFLNGGI